MPRLRPLPPPDRTWAICSGCFVGSGVYRMAFTPLKTVVFPRIPIASVKMATIAKPGARTSVRPA